MANRENHYEAAFESLLRSRQIPYVAVDEARRSLIGEGALARQRNAVQEDRSSPDHNSDSLPRGTLKSLDFIVSPPGGPSWLVDVKGRRFPSGDEQKQYWKNWSPREDLYSLACWEELFGDSFHGLLVFAYHLVADRSPLPADQLLDFRGSRYAFLAMDLAEYTLAARPISESWDTVAVPTPLFRQQAVPVESLFQPDLFTTAQ